ncbi:hypothetical protein KSC_024130 [Ktedonobacter sp. SOSP1-52]|nr:hypothetical protein KSC_024130 [Ktedonobacter sp. SOSP1-52]
MRWQLLNGCKPRHEPVYALLDVGDGLKDGVYGAMEQKSGLSSELASRAG